MSLLSKFPFHAHCAETIADEFLRIFADLAVKICALTGSPCLCDGIFFAAQAGELGGYSQCTERVTAMPKVFELLEFCLHEWGGWLDGQLLASNWIGRQG